MPIACELASLFESGDIETKINYREPKFYDFSGWLDFDFAAGCITVYFCKVYLETIIKESAKDHYNYVIQRLSYIFKKKVPEREGSSLFVTNFEILLGDNLYIRFILPSEFSDIDKVIGGMFSIMRDMIINGEIMRQELLRMSKKTPFIEYHSDERWVVNYIYRNDNKSWEIKLNYTDISNKEN